MSTYYGLFSNRNDSNSPRDVDAFLYNMLARRFFIKSGYRITLETWPLKECLEKSTNWTVHSVTNGESRNVVKMHSMLKHKDVDEVVWSAARAQLTKFLKHIRARNAAISGDAERHVYGVLNLGPYVRFYDLAPFQDESAQYLSGGAYHVEHDDSKIEGILFELDCKMRSSIMPVRVNNIDRIKDADLEWPVAKL